MAGHEKSYIERLKALIAENERIIQEAKRLLEELDKKSPPQTTSHAKPKRSHQAE